MNTVCEKGKKAYAVFCPAIKRKESAMKENVTVAQNGIKIYSYEIPEKSGFQISLFLCEGSMYETPEHSGYTHFLEHALVRNVGKLMRGELYSTLDTHGLELSACTYAEMMQISLYGSREKLGIASDIIALFLCPIVLTRAEIDAERARIKAEIRESGDRSSLVSFTNGIVHRDTSLSRSIIGSIKSVNSATASRLEEYRRRVFTAENLFVYVTGGASCNDIEYLSNRLSEHPVASGESRLNVAPVPSDFGKRGGSVYIKNDSFTMLRFTFDLDMSRVSVAETDLIFDVLLTGNNSHLFLELSEQLGYCYDVGGNLERYSNIGTLSFYFELREAHIYDAVARTVEVLRCLKNMPFEPRACMKATYVTNSGLLEDDVRELNFTMAYEGHILGLGYRDIAERAFEYERITPTRLVEVAREIFRQENLTLTVKGNKRRIDKSRLEQILAVL